VGPANAQVADPPSGRPSRQPLGLTSLPQRRHQTESCLTACRFYGTGEPSLFSLLSSYSPTPSFRKRELTEGILGGRMDPYGSARQQRVSEKMSGRWEAGSSRVAVLKRKRKEEEKYQQEVVFCFHVHIW